MKRLDRDALVGIFIAVFTTATTLFGTITLCLLSRKTNPNGMSGTVLQTPR